MAVACAAAFGLAGYLFVQNRQHQQAIADQGASLDASTAALQKAEVKIQQKTTEETRARELADKLTEEQLAQATLAAEAARMAELKAEQESIERRTRFQKLNEMLAREVEAREKAERAAAELAVQIEQLENAMATVAKDQISVVEQQRTKSQSILSEQKKVLAEIARHKQELNALAEKQKVVEQNHAQILANQIKIEEQILSEGGEITVPNYRNYSPNYRPIRNP